MSFLSKLLGRDKKKDQLMEPPEHDLQPAPPDDLMVVKDKQTNENISSSPEAADQVEAQGEQHEENLNNKDSP